jgi:hypothetical protein
MGSHAGVSILKKPSKPAMHIRPGECAKKRSALVRPVGAPSGLAFEAKNGCMPLLYAADVPRT